MYNMQASSENEGLDAVGRKLPIRIHKWAGFYDQGELTSETYFRNDQGETTEHALILKTIHRGYTLTKLARANWMSFIDNWTSCTDLGKFDHRQVYMEVRR